MGGYIARRNIKMMSPDSRSALGTVELEIGMGAVAEVEAAAEAEVEVAAEVAAGVAV